MDSTGSLRMIFHSSNWIAMGQCNPKVVIVYQVCFGCHFPRVDWKSPSPPVLQCFLVPGSTWLSYAPLRTGCTVPEFVLRTSTANHVWMLNTSPKPDFLSKDMDTWGLCIMQVLFDIFSLSTRLRGSWMDKLKASRNIQLALLMKASVCKGHFCVVKQLVVGYDL